jgi:hypothetical protein
MDVEDFIRIWANASASERQTAQSFVIQLCRVLGVAAPNDEKVGDPDYGFERIVRFLHDDLSSHWGYIDCYRRECFVLEAKQTAKRLANTPDKQQMKLVGPDVVERKMEKARAQAKGYTPKAMVETLVQATIIDVLQNEWEATSVQIDKLEREGYLRKACELAKSFHNALCHIAVLDPACGTGNFLYIAMDRMKGLEGEVVERLASLGVSQRVLETDGLSVGPRQFMGIEKNPQAVWIATVVMWIGHLQWHYRHSGQVLTSNPVLKNYCVIEQGDAILRTTKMPCSLSTDGVRHIDPFAPAWP